MENTTDWNLIIAKVAEILAICSEADEMERYYTVVDSIPDAEATVRAINEFFQF